MSLESWTIFVLTFKQDERKLNLLLKEIKNGQIKELCQTKLKKKPGTYLVIRIVSRLGWGYFSLPRFSFAEIFGGDG